MNTYELSTDISARIDQHTQRTETCWLWTACLDGNGYGLLNRDVQGRHTTLRTHRYSFIRANGPIPDGMVVDHVCHVKACLNPEHLRLATSKQNAENRVGAQANNTSSGVRGVYWHKQAKKWRAMVRHNQKLISVGLFLDIADAEAAVKEARLRLFTHSDADRISL